MSSDLPTLLATMQPVLDPGRFAFATVGPDRQLDLHSVIASVREREGLSVIVAEQDAIGLGLKVDYVAAWITLTVQSDLAAVGLTAAFSNALADAGLSCNVVAGNHHDHVFVPYEQAGAAMAVLQSLQARAATQEFIQAAPTSGRPGP